MEPLVSIVTPVYNGEKTIGKTIESVINQTYNKFEMIIVDDLSNDKTVDIIKKYQKEDDRIKLFILDTIISSRNFLINSFNEPPLISSSINFVIISRLS